MSTLFTILRVRFLQFQAWWRERQTRHILREVEKELGYMSPEDEATCRQYLVKVRAQRDEI